MNADINRWYTIGGVNGGKPIWLPNVIVLVGDGSTVTFYIKADHEPGGFIEVIAKKNLGKFEGTIHPDFERFDQSHIVNLNYVERIWKNIILLKDPLGWERNLTKPYRDTFKRHIGLAR